MPDSFDVIVVGAGLAGSACALALARNGVRVCVCERGAWPGEKSLSGMILYGRPLADLIPAFWKDAPVERAITRRRFSDRKSTRLNSSHANISYAVFCL